MPAIFHASPDRADRPSNGETVTLPLSDLPGHVEEFGSILGVQGRTFRDQDPVNIEAAELVGRLHDALDAGATETTIWRGFSCGSCSACSPPTPERWAWGDRGTHGDSGDPPPEAGSAFTPPSREGGQPMGKTKPA